VWYRIGVCDWYMDNDDSAKAYFDKVYEQDDKHYLVNAFLADYYLYMYKNDLDEEKYEKALKHSQYQCEIIDSANHFVRRAKIYMEKKLLLKAREVLNIAMEQDENYPDIYYNMAVTYVYDGDFSKAIEYFKKALDIGIEMYQAPQRVLYGGLINAYCCIQEPDKANKILEMSGEENNEWYFKKRELIAKKKYGYSSMKLAKVYKEWVEACGYNEYATEALIGIAKIYILKDDYKSAQKYIKQAIKCANNNADKLCDIYISLGETIYEDKRDFKRAMKYFKEAITYDKKTNGENARLYLWMAAIYAESGKTKDAKKFYEDFDGECAKHYGSVKNYIN
jgi:Tfp pilus assembly protein PilF